MPPPSPAPGTPQDWLVRARAKLVLAAVGILTMFLNQLSTAATERKRPLDQYLNSG